MSTKYRLDIDSSKLKRFNKIKTPKKGMIMGLFDLFKKNEEPREPYTREQFQQKYTNYPNVIIEDWAKRNHPNRMAPSIGEQIETFRRENQGKVVIIVKIDEPDTYGLVAE